MSEPASCQGYLASYANPNYAFIVHELVMPQEGSVGDVLAPLAKQHKGGIEACIP